MPGRTVPLITDEYYHVYNRGANKIPIFLQKRDYVRAVELIRFYSYKNPPLRFSKYLKLSLERKQNFMDDLVGHERLVDVICYCLMPNHFHLLLKQVADNGISIFLSNYQNSYTRYFNTKI